MAANKYTTQITEMITALGGKENIVSLTHCATRLRFVLKDDSLVNDADLKKIDIVVGTNPTASQYQLIIGNEVNAVFDELIATGITNGDNEETSEVVSNGKAKNIFQNILDAITGCMTPMIPALTAAGMMKVIQALILRFNLLQESDPSYRLFVIIGDAAFYFIPILLAVFAARKFKVNTSLAVITIAVLVHPSFTSWVTSGDPISLFGLPVAPVSYSYSIIPTILTVWIMSYIEKGVDRITPKVLKIILNPTLVLLISAPLALLVLGPLGYQAGKGLAAVVEALQGTFGIVLLPVLAAATPFIVMVGMHHALTPIFLATFAITGYDSLILLAQVCANLAQGGASLAVAVRTKNLEMKQIAIGAGIPALMGITEPAIYGVTLKLRRPMIAAAIGSAVAGLYASITHVKIYVLNNSIMTAFAMADNGNNLIHGLITLALTIAVPFVLVFIIGFDREAA